jgi:hypothetical protein
VIESPFTGVLALRAGRAPPATLRYSFFLMIGQEPFYGLVVTYVYNLKVPIRKDFFSSPT